MAVLKIPQSTLQANVGQATPVSEGAIPMTIAKAYGQAIGEVGKQVEKVAKDQRDINDQITLNEMVRDAVVKMEKTRAEVSLNSDLTCSVHLRLNYKMRVKYILETAFEDLMEE